MMGIISMEEFPYQYGFSFQPFKPSGINGYLVFLIVLMSYIAMEPNH